MALKSYKPTTPSQRGLVLIDRSALHKGPAGQGIDRRSDEIRRS